MWDEASSHIYSSYYLECIKRDVIYDTVVDLVIIDTGSTLAGSDDLDDLDW